MIKFNRSRPKRVVDVAEALNELGYMESRSEFWGSDYIRFYGPYSYIAYNMFNGTFRVYNMQHELLMDSSDDKFDSDPVFMLILNAVYGD